MSKTVILEKITPSIAAATNRVVADNANSLDAGDAAVLTKEFSKEAAAIIVNQTNNEPWYQSRVTWGIIVSIASPIVAPLVSRIIGHAITIGPDEQAAISEALTTFGVGVGGLFSLYGRWKAKKPIGM